MSLEVWLSNIEGTVLACSLGYKKNYKKHADQENSVSKKNHNKSGYNITLLCRSFGKG
jgi:hypothetical protein